MLTLTGTASVANYQTALRSVQFQHAGDNPGSRQDGRVHGQRRRRRLAPAATRTIDVTRRQRRAHAHHHRRRRSSYTEGDGRGRGRHRPHGRPIPDSTQIAGATVADHGELRLGRGRARVHRPARDHRHLQRRDRHADADRHRVGGRLPGGAALGHLREHLGQPDRRDAHGELPGDRRSSRRREQHRHARHQRRAGQRRAGGDDRPAARPPTPRAARPRRSTAGSPSPTPTTPTSRRGRSGSRAASSPATTLVFVEPERRSSGIYNSGTGVLTLTGTATRRELPDGAPVDQFQPPTTTRSARRRSSSRSTTATWTRTSRPRTSRSRRSTTRRRSTPRARRSRYTEDDGPVAVDTGLDADRPGLRADPGRHGRDQRPTSSRPRTSSRSPNQNGITGIYNDATGVLTLTGTATVANYQTALRSVTYENISDTPDTGTRTVTLPGDGLEVTAEQHRTRATSPSTPSTTRRWSRRPPARHRLHRGRPGDDDRRRR